MDHWYYDCQQLSADAEMDENCNIDDEMEDIEDD